MIRLKSLLHEWTGETWSSCRQWASHRTRYMSGQEKAVVTIQKAPSLFQLEYVGPGTGISLAHAKGGAGDTLHQLFNILICEMNPWLDATQYKPRLDDIVTRCTKDGEYYIFLIQVPIEESDRPWQINHRGGWGHDPGKGAVKSASPNVPEREIKTEITNIPGSGKITTHFATYPVGPVTPPSSNRLPS